MQKEKIMYRLRNMTFLLTIISCLTVKTIQTQRTITTTVVIIIIAARIATTAATTTMAIQPNISVITISSLAITAAAAVAAAATPRTTTIATPRTINNVTITHLETPTTAATAITAQYKNAILILPTIKTTIINSTNSIKQIADASINMNSSVNGSENANPYANVNQNVNANVNIFLPGTYQAYAQQQQQQQQIQQQQRQQQQQIQQKRPTTIKKSIIGKGLKLPLTILTKQQQQHAILAIAQTIQKPFQTLFGILNRNPASLSTLGNATATATSTSTATSNAMALNTTLYACSCRCGERNDETRIVGGSTTLPNEYPWMARLSYFNRFYCGGTLINDRYILTAAHCIKGFMWFMIKVTFGEHDRCKIKERPETRFVLRAFTQKFSFANFDNDIALLRLNDRVPITNFIKPICLPRFKERDNQFVGIKAIATGWGTLKEDGKPSCVLQEVIVPVLDNRACVEQTNYTQKMITKNMLCAGYPGKGEKDSCQGDSGGPLIRIRPDDQRYEQIGIVSWGNGCARPNYPGVYTRITKYLDWIIENSKDGCFCQDGI